ncbi:MAG TPA: acyl-CoA dehydrogenase family protein [Acetobacteraceae bacterium]|jgi:alkylation response protein AidB-like acyl-CoA dehydrogenase
MDGLLSIGSETLNLASEFAKTAAENDREARFPTANFDRLREAGLLSLTAARADGGEDAGLTRAVKLVGDIAQGCPSTALVLAMQLIQLKIGAANPNWPTHLRARIARSGGLINALRVEPALGTPARGGLPETTARRTEHGWSITGRKIYSTGAPGLTWMLVWARTEEETVRTGMFLVPASSRGVQIVETWDQLGLRASGSHDVLFTDVAVPADHALDIRPHAEWGARDPLQVAWNTLTIAALYTGVATAARNWLVQFLRDRTPTNLGAPLAALPRMQEAVGEIEALLTTNRRLIASATADHDAGQALSTDECNLIKTVAAENAIDVVQRAVERTGNHGLARSNPLERHLRDVLCARVHTPQPDAAHLAAGRAALGQ